MGSAFATVLLFLAAFRISEAVYWITAVVGAFLLILVPFVLAPRRRRGEGTEATRQAVVAAVTQAFPSAAWTSVRE